MQIYSGLFHSLGKGVEYFYFIAGIHADWRCHPSLLFGPIHVVCVSPALSQMCRSRQYKNRWADAESSFGPILSLGLLGTLTSRWIYLHPAWGLFRLGGWWEDSSPGQRELAWGGGGLERGWNWDLLLHQILIPVPGPCGSNPGRCGALDLSLLNCRHRFERLVNSSLLSVIWHRLYYIVVLYEKLNWT